ncbi:hypothetical protein SDC9_164932 [bioreactor metagenome]|uniref:Uncharacterized protein n=1 Tax=bioreactor metagenome TaxID=1076179 RepID=A0A645FSZ3_9ZZZZ
MSGLAALGEDNQHVVADSGFKDAECLVHKGTIAISFLAQEFGTDAQAGGNDVGGMVHSVALQNGEITVKN